MQRMEHCHDWAEKEQCDRSRESRVRTSELRRSRIENKNADFKRLFCGRHFCLPIDGHKHVGAILPAKPLSSAWSRQHAPDFPGWPTSMLASTSPQSLCLPPGHANTPRIFQAGQRPCWRRPPRKSFALRRLTPTCPRFSRSAGVIVGVELPAKPLPFVESRQHAPDFPGRPTSMLASTSPQILCLPPGHANKLRLILVALTIDILAGTSEE